MDRGREFGRRVCDRMDDLATKGLCRTMFDLDQFIADCRAARAANGSSKTICEFVRRTVSDPPGVLRTLGEPNCARIGELYRSDELTSSFALSDRAPAASICAPSPLGMRRQKMLSSRLSAATSFPAKSNGPSVDIWYGGGRRV